VAINKADWKQQEFFGTHFRYQLALGEDVAGEVVDVSGSVTRFKLGDRVVLSSRDPLLGE
jgi:NADPH:quinone reductase-like Zn-dependent oxidoreductase